MTATLTAIGDSLTTLASAYEVPGHLVWSPQLATLLGREGLKVRARSFGVGGERADQMLARADVLSYYDAPAVVAIYAGVNDKVQSVADATIQAYVQALVKAAKFGVTGAGIGVGVTVADQTALPSGEVGQRYIVLSDTSTAGGMPAWHSSQTTGLTGAGGSAQTVWECRYSGQAGERGWGRIATAATPPTHCNRIVVVGRHYDNWTTGGDTPAAASAANAALRTDLQAAVTAENVTVNGRASVVYADVYALMRSRIVAGTDPNFSADTSVVATTAYSAASSWHQVQNDLHLNSYGHALIAQACRTAIPTAWVTELAAL